MPCKNNRWREIDQSGIQRSQQEKYIPDEESYCKNKGPRLQKDKTSLQNRVIKSFISVEGAKKIKLKFLREKTKKYHQMIIEIRLKFVI